MIHTKYFFLFTLATGKLRFNIVPPAKSLAWLSALGAVLLAWPVRSWLGVCHLSLFIQKELEKNILDIFFNVPMSWPYWPAVSFSFLPFSFPYNTLLYYIIYNTVLLRCNFHSLKMYNSQHLGGQGKRSLQAWDQSSLHSQSQASQCCTVRTHLKQANKTTHSVMKYIRVFVQTSIQRPIYLWEYS